MNPSKKKGKRLTNCSPILLVPRIWRQVFGFLRINIMIDQESNGFSHGFRCQMPSPPAVSAEAERSCWLFGGRFYMHFFLKHFLQAILDYTNVRGSCVGMTWLIVIIVFVAYTAWFTTITFILHLKNYSQSGSPLESLIMNDQLPSEIPFAGLFL